MGHNDNIVKRTIATYERGEGERISEGSHGMKLFLVEFIHLIGLKKKNEEKIECV